MNFLGGVKGGVCQGGGVCPGGRVFTKGGACLGVSVQRGVHLHFANEAK